MSTAFDFTGRTVIVTGAANGIGLALSQFFAEAGATICIADIDEAGLAEATTGPLAEAIPAVVDVSDSARSQVQSRIWSSGPDGWMSS